MAETHPTESTPLEPEQTTVLLAQAKDHYQQTGKHDYDEEVYFRVRDELLRMARAELRGQPPGHSLGSVELVDSVFLRSIQASTRFESKEHFYNYAHRAMRNWIIDRARRRARTPQPAAGEDVNNVADANLNDDKRCLYKAQDAYFDLEEALERIERLEDERYQKGVEIFRRCFYGGHAVSLGVDDQLLAEFVGYQDIGQAAAQMGVSRATAYRYFNLVLEQLPPQFHPSASVQGNAATQH